MNIKKSISESLKGKRNPFFGKKHSNETLAKISEKSLAKKTGCMEKVIN